MACKLLHFNSIIVIDKCVLWVYIIDWTDTYNRLIKKELSSAIYLQLAAERAPGTGHWALGTHAQAIRCNTRLSTNLVVLPLGPARLFIIKPFYTFCFRFNINKICYLKPIYHLTGGRQVRAVWFANDNLMSGTSGASIAQREARSSGRSRRFIRFINISK